MAQLRTLWIDCPHMGNETSRAVTSKMPDLAKNLLLLAALALIAIYLAHRFPEMEKGTDFPDFYAAAKLVHDGLGHQLYDPAVQERFQIRYSGRIGTLYIHPAFEALFYLPIAAAPPHRAYVLWSLLNLALLIAIARSGFGAVAVFRSHEFCSFDTRRSISCRLPARVWVIQVPSDFSARADSCG